MVGGKEGINDDAAGQIAVSFIQKNVVLWLRGEGDTIGGRRPCGGLFTTRKACSGIPYFY